MNRATSLALALLAITAALPRRRARTEGKGAAISFLRTFGQTPQAIRNASHPLATI